MDEKGKASLYTSKTGASLTNPDGSIRLGTKHGSLHARVANAINNPTPQGASAFKTPVSFANFGKIMLFPDVSGSMGDRVGPSDSYRGEAGETKISLLKKAFETYINDCNRALNAVGLASFPEQAYESPTNDHEMIKSIVNQLEANGGTPLVSALGYVLANEPITHAVIISDGDADDRLQSVELAKAFAAKLVKIDTVHIGSSTGGEELLKQIAEITGGIYVKFTDVQSFAKTFSYLSPKKRGLLTSSKNAVALLGAAEVKF